MLHKHSDNWWYLAERLNNMGAKNVEKMLQSVKMVQQLQMILRRLMPHMMQKTQSYWKWWHW